MYHNGFVVAVKINGKTVEENDFKIVLPFDSEYSLMLKNRNDRKAVARVYIDGEEITQKGRLILDANSSLNLERYIDDLNNGARFKFVPLSDSRVSDKGDSEKGFIEVRFQLIKPPQTNFIVHEDHYYHHHWDDIHYYHPYWVGTWPNTSITYVNDFGTATGGSFTNNLGGTSVTAYNCSSTPTISNESAGATIPGSDSSQKFSYAYVGELESGETVIRFQLVGTKDAEVIRQYIKTHCTGCGKKYDVNDKYCSSCGEKR